MSLARLVLERQGGVVHRSIHTTRIQYTLPGRSRDASSPDGRRLAAGKAFELGHEGKSPIGDAATGELLQTLSGHTGRVEHVASQEVGFVEHVAGVVRFVERWTRPDEEGMPMQQ